MVFIGLLPFVIKYHHPPSTIFFTSKNISMCKGFYGYKE